MIQPAAPNRTVILLLALVKLLIPFLLIYPAFELQRDEFLYYQQGQHFDLGYLENPPLLSYLAVFSSWLGGSEWTVKLWPALFGGLTVIVTCLITARLGGKGFAQSLTGFGVISGAFLRIHLFFQPNILDIFFWTCSLYFLVLFIQTKNSKYFWGITICIALGWWSKYSIVFLAASILVGLLLTKYRSIFLERTTYTAGLAALLIILPNIWWQYDHNWPLVHHMQELRETQLVFVTPVDFIKEQFLLLLPVFIIWVAGLVWYFRNSGYKIVGWIYLSVIALLILGSGKSYYSLGIYPALLAAGGVAWENLSKSMKWLRYVVVVLVTGTTIPFIPVGIPVYSPQKLASFYKKSGIEKTGLLKWEDQKEHELPMDFADMLGWKELNGKTEAFFNTLPDSIKANTIIYCHNYGLAGSLKFYSKNDDFKNKVITVNGSFLLWIPETLLMNHLIYIGSRMPDQDDEVFRHFERVTVIDSITNKLSRQYGDKIIFFENIDSTGLKLAQDELKEMKKRFNR